MDLRTQKKAAGFGSLFDSVGERLQLGACVRRNRAGFVVLYIENCIEFRDLEQIMNLLGQV